MKIISVFNNKGGVGKSTLTYHLGAALSEKGKKVLLIDLDPQSNLTLYGLSEERLEKITKLTKMSHAKPMDINTVLPWTNGIDKSLYPKQPEHLWIYATPYCEQLSEEQKHELAWLEIGRDISMFIWFEQTMPVLYMGYTNSYHDKLNSIVSDYLMIFSKEEMDGLFIVTPRHLYRTDWLCLESSQVLDIQLDLWKGKFRGQMQKWFLMRFAGTDDQVNIETKHAEFSCWKWLYRHEQTRASALV
mgnify:CR=1 FL=1